MAKPALNVDLDAIYAALLREPRMKGLSEANLADVKDIISLLPGAVGHRLGEKFTVAGYYLVAADFCRAILDSSFDLNYPDGGFVRSELELYEVELRETGEKVKRYLVSENISEAEVLRSDDFPFGRRAKRLIGRREFTFHRALHLHPGIFLPEVVAA